MRAARHIPVLMAVALASPPALAAEQFACTLREGCGTSECGGDVVIRAILSPAATGWKLVLDDTTIGSFVEFDSSDTARHFVSRDIDPDAGAAGLLSIFAKGEAFLSLHGNFMTPAAQTYTGRCTLETS